MSWINNTYVKVIIGLIAVIILAKLLSLVGIEKGKIVTTPSPPQRVWEIKSVDTMKYSRDLSLQKLNDPSFDLVIDSQVKSIKNLNANYVAIATPYDEKFVPVLSRWVKTARKYNLHVWFRGNFSGWEGWFGYPRNLTRDQHLELMRGFVQNNPSLFENGDAFSPCPECENGGPGDPRSNGDVEGFRKFMIQEHQVTDEEFKKIGKKVRTDLAPMNYDVAKVVMDPNTVKAMDGIIVVDHYVETPEQLAKDVDNLAQGTSARIFLGEIGAPIPNITGNLNEAEQDAWLSKALNLIAHQKSLIGINYWVAIGGSTALFKSDITPKPASETLKKYFSFLDLDRI